MLLRHLSYSFATEAFVVEVHWILLFIVVGKFIVVKLVKYSVTFSKFHIP